MRTGRVPDPSAAASGTPPDASAPEPGSSTSTARPPPPIPRWLGAAALVDFWASWCARCRQAFPDLDQLYRTYQGDGLDMLGVALEEDSMATRWFWAVMRRRFPVAWDQSGAVRERFRVLSLPTTVLFD